ncbi:outer membrane protein assembly factor BamB family protein [Verrucomicrobiota bacterium sgz303538]
MKLAVAFWLLLVSLQQAFTAAPIEPLAQKWVARYNSLYNQDDFSTAVAVDSAGDVYTVGYTVDADQYAYPALIKQNGITGGRIWEWRMNDWEWRVSRWRYSFGRSSTDSMPVPASISIGSDDNPVIHLGTQLYKIHASAGMQLWSVSLPQPPSYSYGYYGMTLDAAGDVFVCGTAYYWGGTTYKFSGVTGAKLWERGVLRTAKLEAIAADLDGNVIVTGSDYDKATGRDGLYTAKYSGLDGSVRWETRLTDPSKTLSARLVTMDHIKNPVVVTTSGLILKYSAGDGALLWQRQGLDNPNDVLCDTVGDVFVARGYYGSDGATLLKYTGVDGTLRWSTRLGEFFSLLLRGSEILAAGQRMVSPVGWHDLLLVALDPTNGVPRWEATYGLPLLKDRVAITPFPNRRIALQPSGGVVITGCSQGTSTGYDFATLRYAPGPTVRLAGTAWVLQTSVRFSTRASGNNMEASLWWEYGPTVAYGHTTAAVNVSPATTPGTYQTTITGLPENTAFHARAVVTSAAGTTYGEDFVFTTGWDANGNRIPDQWELDNWGNTSGHSPFVDDDRDGLPNLLEYAFGQNPRVPNSPGAVPIAQVGDYLTATITKQPFVKYTVEASSDLQSWSTADTTVLVDDATTLTVRGNTPISSGGAQFLRIRVTAQ